MKFPPQLSYWEHKSFFDQIDYIIIGAGIVGLSTAIHLQDKYPKAKIIVLERGTLPSGASTKNAGFACFGSLTELIDDLDQMKPQEVWQTLSMRWQGLKTLKNWLGDSTMDYKQLGGHELFKKEDRENYERCCDQMSSINKSIKTIVGETPFVHNDKSIAQWGFKKTEHLISNQLEGQIDTGKMMSALRNLALRKNIQIFNGIKAKEIEDYGNGVAVSTQHRWEIHCKQLFVCTNGYAAKLLPKLKVKPARNQVMITSPIPKLSFKGTFHYDRGYFYFRNVGNRVLIGGGRHLALEDEMTGVFGSTPLIQSVLKRLLHETILPKTDFQIDYNWSGILGVSKQKKPIVEKVSKNVIAAVRLGGMGIAIGTEVGAQAARILD